MPVRTHQRPKPSTVAHQAKLIATGQMPFPQGLGSAERVELGQAVQEIRRNQLLRWLASEIARHLCTQQPHQGEPHAS